MSLTLILIQQAPALPVPVPFAGWNPFGPLGSAAGKVVADGWTAAMLATWNAGAWLLRVALHIIDAFMTPDLREDGPGRPVYELSLWLGGVIFIAMSSVQLAISGFQRDGRGLARVLIGYGQFVMVWAAFVTYAVVLIAGVDGLTSAILSQLLHIDKWADFEPLGTALDAQDITEGSVATVMGVLGIVLILAAIGHTLVAIARSAALMVLVGTASISAGGLGSEVGRSWFWKTFRWFHAAAFTPVLMALLLGLGVTFTTGVATGQEDSIQQAVGTAVPSALLVLVAAFVPLALFKLLAFTDPNTNSGSAMRAGLSAAGGVSGLLGAGGNAGKGSGAASSVDAQGRSQAESNGQSDSEGRLAGAMKKLGPVGAAVGGAASAAAGTATKAASLGADLTNQMGVGHGQYVPDFGGSRGKGGGADRQAASGGKHGGDPETDDANAMPATGTDGGGGQPFVPNVGTGDVQGMPQAPPGMPSALVADSSGGGGAGGGKPGQSPTPGGGAGGAGGGAAGGGATAGATPPPVV